LVGRWFGDAWLGKGLCQHGQAGQRAGDESRWFHGRSIRVQAVGGGPLSQATKKDSDEFVHFFEKSAAFVPSLLMIGLSLRVDPSDELIPTRWTLLSRLKDAGDAGHVRPR